MNSLLRHVLPGSIAPTVLGSIITIFTYCCFWYLNPNYSVSMLLVALASVSGYVWMNFLFLWKWYRARNPLPSFSRPASPSLPSLLANTAHFMFFTILHAGCWWLISVIYLLDLRTENITYQPNPSTPIFTSSLICPSQRCSIFFISLYFSFACATLPSIQLILLGVVLYSLNHGSPRMISDRSLRSLLRRDINTLIQWREEIRSSGGINHNHNHNNNNNHNHRNQHWSRRITRIWGDITSTAFTGGSSSRGNSMESNNYNEDSEESFGSASARPRRSTRSWENSITLQPIVLHDNTRLSVDETGLIGGGLEGGGTRRRSRTSSADVTSTSRRLQQHLSVLEVKSAVVVRDYGWPSAGTVAGVEIVNPGAGSPPSDQNPFGQSSSRSGSIGQDSTEEGDVGLISRSITTPKKEDSTPKITGILRNKGELHPSESFALSNPFNTPPVDTNTNIDTQRSDENENVDTTGISTEQNEEEPISTSLRRSSTIRAAGRVGWFEPSLHTPDTPTTPATPATLAAAVLDTPGTPTPATPATPAIPVMRDEDLRHFVHHRGIARITGEGSRRSMDSRVSAYSTSDTIRDGADQVNRQREGQGQGEIPESPDTPGEQLVTPKV